MQIKELLRLGSSQLEQSSIESYFLEGRILLMHATELSHENILVSYDKELSEVVSDYKLEKSADDIKKEFLSYITRRKSLEPIAYIIGHKEFYGRKFLVDHNTLIPRPETELLVDAILDYIENNNLKDHSLQILDIGTGSGNISCTLGLELDNSKIIATDISEEALNIANKNVKAFCISNKVNLIKSNLFSDLNSFKNSFDIIVSNPPYIAKEEESLVAYETKNFEPTKALYAEESGLRFYREILEQSKKFLKKNGMLFFEIGYNQIDNIVNLANKNSFRIDNRYKDIHGITRVINCKQN